jgi:hypothetical protein
MSAPELLFRVGVAVFLVCVHWLALRVLFSDDPRYFSEETQLAGGLAYAVFTGLTLYAVLGLFVR